jgi:2Fe-2S type ferredoxin
MMRQRPVFPIHAAPSVLDRKHGRRRPISYEEAIDRLVDLVLEHRNPDGRTLIYGSGQLDYFSIFAMQEVFRLLGVRNLTGNAEHCLNAGAVHNEILTGQEGPFLTLAQSMQGPNRFYIFSGWNGFVTHPPAFAGIARRDDFDAYLIEVMETESAKIVAKKLGDERLLFIRSRTDPLLALAVAHEVFANYPDAIEERFIEHFADKDSFDKYVSLATSDRLEPRTVAERIAPEPDLVERLVKGIQGIARKLAEPGVVPINIPSVGLSQTSGVVAHCLWGNLMAMVGKYGLKPDGTPAGGTLRIPGQINAETEVQGLSRKYFMGRVPFTDRAEAARRMDLPEDAYDMAFEDEPRAALDYSDPTPGTRELFLCFGTQFEANMMDRDRWIRKLQDPDVCLVVVDPIPDPFTLEHAELIIPSPPHPATTKVYQNGEWKMSVSVPQKKAPAETRSDPTIIYDLMAEIARRVEDDDQVAEKHPDLARHAKSGYLRERFMAPENGSDAGLLRFGGEVSRPQLWARILDYMNGGSGPLYCSPDHADGTPIQWDELLEAGSIVYGGVGTNRYVLDYDTPDHAPFGDIYRRPGAFKFFLPTEHDLSFPDGIIFNSGRSQLSDDRNLIRFSTSTFNSGKATPAVGMPDENPLHVSKMLAAKHGFRTGDAARVTNRMTGTSMVLPVVVTDRVKGESTYVSFHKSRAQIEKGSYINAVTEHLGRCAYSGQTSLKATQVLLERIGAPQAKAPMPETTRVIRHVAELLPRSSLPVDTTLLDPKVDIPIWKGQASRLFVTDIFEETHDVYTYRFQGNPLVRFVYWPGQFATLVLNINGKKVVRSYTISSTPTRPYVLEITVKRVPGGLVSNWLADTLKVGDEIQIAGPKGKFSLIPGRIPQKLLFLSGGSGVTPMMSMTRWLCDISANVDVKFFTAIRSPNDFIFQKELEHLTAQYRMFEPIICATSRESDPSWTGLQGRITREIIEQIAPDLHERNIYMCGPGGFMEAVKGMLKELDFDLANLHIESFGGVRTGSANKPAPPPPMIHRVTPLASAAPAVAAPVETFMVGFARSDVKIEGDAEMPLLDLAEENDIDLDYGCRSGSCGDCRVRLLDGTVDQMTDEGLDAEEIKAGYILTCVATPTSDCTLDA